MTDSEFYRAWYDHEDRARESKADDAQPMTTDLDAMMREVLFEHAYFSRVRSDVVRCKCGANIHDGGPSTVPHRAHVAAALVSRLGDVLAAAKSEALREAADEFADIGWAHLTALGSVGHAQNAADWLRARADQQAGNQ